MKWEYFVEAGTSSNIDLEHLNRQGEEGWEVCAVIPNGSAFIILFKRQLPQHV